MVADYKKYNLFLEFIQTFSESGFKGIDREHPLLAELEELMSNNNQFFFVGDIIQIQIHFTSKRSTEMIGIKPEDISPYHFFEATHPDDIQRHNLARSKLFGLAQALFIAEKGDELLSTNFRIRKPDGLYSNFLFQCYLFYSPAPVKTVYLIQIHTDIGWFKKNKNGYHYYVGNDLSLFRYPDEKLLTIGNVFSDREFEILKLIKTGLSSEQIAEKLFLSVHTVNTHRANILSKANKSTIWEVIYELIERGLLQ